jgi:threonine dehydratase
MRPEGRVEPSVTSPAALSAAEAAREVAAAERRIRRYVRETPLEPSPALSAATGADVHLKLETVQVTGSFKARGAFNKLLALPPAERARGIVAASTGNHGLATAHALNALGIAGEIFLPAAVSPAKLDALRSRGARVRLVDDDPGLVESIARRAAADSGRTYVSPYNDAQVIGGQGTVAVELRRQLEGFDCVLVPAGGGGLIAGIAADLARHAPTVRVIGCQPLACPILIESVRAGRLLELPSLPSVSDATVGLLEPGAITFPLCRELVAEWIGIPEPDLRAAVRWVADKQSMMVEGAAALTVAAMLAHTARWRGGRVVLVLSGSHIALPVFADILARS